MEYWHDARFYRWQGTEYVRPSEWRDAPLPEDGATAYMGSDWQECSEEDADVVEVPYTAWGDYCGSSVDRSNYRSFVRDYPDTFIEISGGYWSHTLYIRPEKLAETEGLLEEINALFDYPLYDDEDHSMLEMDEAWEAWDSYLRMDVDRSLGEHDIDTDEWTDDDWDFVRQRFYSITSEQNEYPYLEDAVNIYFPAYEATVATLAEELTTLGLEHDPRRPNPNQLKLMEEQ